MTSSSGRSERRSLTWRSSYSEGAPTRTASPGSNMEDLLHVAVGGGLLRTTAVLTGNDPRPRCRAERAPRCSAHRLGGRRATYHQEGGNPFATISVPRVALIRRGRISWYSGESYHARKAVIDGNSTMTVRGFSIVPSTTSGSSSKARVRP